MHYTHLKNSKIFVSIILFVIICYKETLFSYSIARSNMLKHYTISVFSYVIEKIIAIVMLHSNMFKKTD